jgi:hypothetical protein
MPLRPHQEEVLPKIHSGCILYGGTGSGKTITSLYYYVLKECNGHIDSHGIATDLGTPTDLVVITTAKKRDALDWQREAAKLGIGNMLDGTVPGSHLTVDSWNNIGKYVDREDAFFIFDEQRLVGAGAWVKHFLQIAKRNRWIMLSATPGDTWLDYIPVFMANGFYKTRGEFKREHVVYNPYVKFPKVDRYLGVGKLVRLKNSILVHMPYEMHTTRHISYVHVDHDASTLEKVVKQRWHVYEDRPLRNVAELFPVMRKVVNSDDSRVSTLLGLLQKHPRLIVFYNFDYELEILRESLHEMDLSSSSPRKNSTKPRDLSTQIVQGSQKLGVNLSSTGKKQFDSGEPTVKKSSRSQQSSSSLKKSSSTSEVTSEKETSFAVAELNGHKHQEIPKTDSWVYLVQYQAGAEAWNCTSTDAMVFYSMNYSYKLFHQSLGRIDRMNTPFTDLWYYVFVSDSAIDRAIQKAQKQKKNFNEAAFVDTIR